MGRCSVRQFKLNKIKESSCGLIQLWWWCNAGGCGSLSPQGTARSCLGCVCLCTGAVCALGAAWAVPAVLPQHGCPTLCWVLPATPAVLPPAAPGTLLGPRWCGRGQWHAGVCCSCLGVSEGGSSVSQCAGAVCGVPGCHFSKTSLEPGLAQLRVRS